MTWWDKVLGWCGMGALGKRGLSPEAFTRRYRALVLKALPSAQVEILEPLHLRITRENGHSSMSFLYNAFEIYRQDHRYLDRVMERYLSTLEELDEELAAQIDPERIVGVVKDTAWLEEVNAAILGKGAEAPKEQLVDVLNEDLVIAYAEDRPNSMRYLTVDDLEHLSIPREGLRKAAGENLLDLLPPPEMHQGQGFYLVTAGGDYEASLITVPRFWTKDRFPLEGELVAAIPARDVLLVTGTGEREGLEKVRELAHQIMEQATYRLTPRLFIVREGGQVSRFEPQSTDPEIP